MWAMLDYSPLSDSAIPCPGAGMTLSRGDLLEIVDESDVQYFQAKTLHNTLDSLPVRVHVVKEILPHKKSPVSL